MEKNWCMDLEQEEGEEFCSSLVDDCISLCQDIGSLLCSRFADGIWASGLAVLKHFEDSITRREGLTETINYMKILNIEPTEDKEDIIRIVLNFFLNNRLDNTE